MLGTTKKFDVVTIGSAVRDIMFFTDEGKLFKTPEDLTSQKLWAFEYGSKIEIDSYCDTLGGGAFNTAYNFIQLGQRSAPLVRVGNDIDGKWILKNMQEHGLNTQLVQIGKDEKTGISMIMCSEKKDRDHIIFVHRGANKDLQVEKKKLQKIKTLWIYINSLAGKKWEQNLENIVEYAKDTNTQIAWNPGGHQLSGGRNKLGRFLKHTDVLILNKDEAIELVLSGVKIEGRDPKFLNKPLYLLNFISDWGPKTVVITLGKKGAVALHNGKMYTQKVINTKVIDTTGVGDAFGAAFVSGLIHEKDNIQNALAWGCFSSSYVVTKAGAHSGILKKDDLIKVVKKHI